MDFSFKQPVRLHSIKFVAKNARTSNVVKKSMIFQEKPFVFAAEHAPKNVKIFANKINMGFDEAESASATQEVRSVDFSSVPFLRRYGGVV